MNPTPKPQKLASKAWLKTSVRVVVFLVVIIGLGWAIRNITSDLEKVRSQTSTQISQLRDKLNTEQSRSETLEIQSEIRSLEKQRDSFWTISIASVAIAVALQFVGMGAPGLFWKQIIHRFGHATPLLPTLGVYFTGHLGRYIPGKAMVFVLRSSGLRRWDVPITTSIVSVFVETLMLMAVGGAVGAIALALLKPPLWLLISAIAFSIAAGVPTLPPIFRQVLGFIARRKSKAVAPEVIEGFDWRLFLLGWIFSLTGWLLVAAATYVVLQGLSLGLVARDQEVELILSCIAAATLPTVLGFFSLIPSGIGIREFVITAVLVPLVGLPFALTTAVWMRVISMIAELCWVGLGFVSNRKLVGEVAKNQASVVEEV